MEQTTSFDTWFDIVQPNDHEDVYSLYRAVKDGANFGFYNCGKANDKSMWFVTTGDGENKLVLASEKARDAFLAQLQARYAGDMTIEGWYQFKRGMSKND